MNNIVADFSTFFIKKYRVTILIALTVIAIGLLSYTTFLKRDGFPAINFPTVITQVQYAIGDKEIIEKDITSVIEKSISEIEGIKSYRSTTFDFGATIVTEFEDSFSAEDGEKLIVDALDNALIPQNTKINTYAIDISKIDNEFDVAYNLAIPNKTLKEVEKESQKIVNKLLELNYIDNAEIISNFTSRVNPVTNNTTEIQNSINKVAIAENDFRFDNSVFIGVSKSNTFKDVVSFSAQAREDINKIAEEVIEEDFYFTYQLDISESVNQQITDLEANALSGLFAVLIIILLFVNWRASVVTSIFIPFVLLTTFFLLYLLGYTLNVITLFSLILVLGLLVDDAIVVVEAIDYQKQKGLKGLKAVRSAIQTVGVADISGTVTTLLVFAPMLFISGILGEFIRQIPLTVILTLIVSVVSALTIIPVISNVILNKTNNKFISAVISIVYLFIATTIYLIATENGSIRIILLSILTSIVVIFMFNVFFLSGKKRKFQKATINVAFLFSNLTNKISESLYNFIKWQFSTGPKKFLFIFANLTIALILIGFGSAFAAGLKFSIFSPPKDSNEMSIRVTFKYDELFSEEDLINLNDNQKINKAEETLNEIQQKIVSSKSTNLEYLSYLNVNSSVATLQMKLVDLNSREETAKQITESLNVEFLDFKGAEVVFSISAAGPPTSDYPFAMQIYESDESVLLNASQDIKEYIENQEQVLDVKTSSFDQIVRRDGERFIQIEAKLIDNEDSTMIQNLQDNIKSFYTAEKLSDLDLEANQVEYDLGQESENQESFNGTIIALILALALMYVLLVLQYNSFLQPLIIFLAIPLSFPGLFPGLYLTENPFSFFVMLGIIGLAGIVVNNSIMLVDFANQSRYEGKSIVESIATAVKLRLRPIIATSLTTIAGLVPLALTEPFWEGLAFSIVFGLISSTLLIVLLLPTFYISIEGIRGMKIKIKNRFVSKLS